MKRLVDEPNDATDFERLLLGSIALDVPPEGAEAALLDRLDGAPVVVLAEAKKKLRHSTWLFFVAAAIGVCVIFFSRRRHEANIPIVQEEVQVTRVTPVSSDVPAMEMPLPSAAPSVAPSAAPPPPIVVKRRAPSTPSPLASAMAAAEAPGQDAAFDKGAAASALGHVNLDECRALAGPSGAGHVSVTFATSGRVQHVAVDPPFDGTERGFCVGAKFGVVQVPPFQGAAVRVGKSFVLQ